MHQQNQKFWLVLVQCKLFHQKLLSINMIKKSMYSPIHCEQSWDMPSLFHFTSSHVLLLVDKIILTSVKGTHGQIDMWLYPWMLIDVFWRKIITIFIIANVKKDMRRWYKASCGIFFVYQAVKRSKLTQKRKKKKEREKWPTCHSLSTCNFQLQRGFGVHYDCHFWSWMTC